MKSTESPKKVKPSFSRKPYSWLISNGYDRFLKLSGKVPANLGPYEYIHTLDTLRNTMADGFNIGVMIPLGHLVIDIDPRNGGLESFDRLLADAYKDEPRIPTLDDLIKGTFTVRTGGGGYHLYYALSPGVKPRGSVKGYSGVGVDLKGSSEQHYVVGPGSVHPDTHERYVESPQPDKPDWLPAPLAPFVVRELRNPFEPRERSDRPHPLWGLITPGELDALLAPLDPKDYRAYTGDDKAWINIMAAAHHATGGDLEAMAIFAAWSASDPDYAGEAHKAVERRWESFKERRSTGDHVATVDSILAAVASSASSNGDLAELLGEPDERLVAAAAVANAVTARKVAIDLEVISDEAGDAAELIEWIEALSDTWRQDDPALLPKFIDKISEQPEIHWPELCAALASRAGGKLSKAQLKKFVRQERDKRVKAAKPVKPTAARIVDTAVNMALEAIEDSPGDIACAPGQPFRYTNGVWEKVDKEWFGHISYEQIEKTVDKDEKGTQALCNYARDAATSIMHKRATQSKDLYFREEMPNCINLLNGTLRFHKDGKYELKPHCREDYLTTQIPYNYDPAATCPAFDKMLEQVFEHLVKNYSIAERDDFMRHLWELFGYIIQSNKDLPVAMFWIGEGQNGKSKIAEILSKLIGPKALLSTDIKSFFSGSNNHATASLEGKLLVMDDDLGSGTIINDGILKKISKNSDMEINPKGKDSRNIIIHASALIITNTRVLIVDTSPGLVRRCFAIYFNTSIAHLQASPLPDIAMLEEMPGILNKAVQGLARLRERKDFKLPKCALDDRKRFLNDSIPALGFWEGLNKTQSPGAEMEVDTIYNSYKYFMQNDGHGKPVSKRDFIDTLNRQGVVTSETSIKGWKIGGQSGKE